MCGAGIVNVSTMSLLVCIFRVSGDCAESRPGTIYKTEKLGHLLLPLSKVVPERKGDSPSTSSHSLFTPWDEEGSFLVLLAFGLDTPQRFLDTSNHSQCEMHFRYHDSSFFGSLEFFENSKKKQEKCLANSVHLFDLRFGLKIYLLD